MTVLHLTDRLDPVFGGVSQAIQTLVKTLSASGIKNEVICMESPDAVFLKKLPFKVHAMGIGFSPWRFNPNLRSWLKENLGNYDVVLVHGLWLYHSYITYKLSAAQKSKSLFKVLIMPHGMLDPYFQKTATRKIKSLRNQILWRLWERRVVASADELLFTCAEEKRLAPTSFKHFKARKMRVVGLGVETPPAFTYEMTEAFRRKCPNLGHRPYFLFMARIHEKKGADLLLAAYQQIRSVRKAKALTMPCLVLAGPGENDLLGTQLQAKVAADPELVDQVFFTGMLEGPAKWGALYNADLFILPSHQENFGIALVEAMACKKAVLTTRNVNIWKEIALSRGGLIGADNQESIQDLLMEWFAMDEFQKERMQEQGYEGYLKYFSCSSVVHNYLSAFQHQEPALP